MTIALERSIDITDPPPGQKLELLNIAAAHRVSVRELADGAGMPHTTLFRLATENHWPTKQDPREVRQAITDYLRSRGVPEEDLVRLFWAHVSKHMVDPTAGRSEDKYGRALPRLPTSRRRAAGAVAPDEEDDSLEPNMLIAKQTLTPAARRHFRLSYVNPFDSEVTDDDEMFVSDEIAYCREACLQAALGGRFVALVGESGAGKTTIAAHMEARVLRDKQPVRIIKPWVIGMAHSDRTGKGLKAAEIVGSIISELDELAKVPQTLDARSKLAYRLLCDSAQAGYKHLLVIEEAHSMPEPTLTHLKRLHEMRLGMRPLLGILLIGHPELKLRLQPSRAHLKEVTQRVEVVELLPLGKDLTAYLEHRARLAGRRLEEFIDAGGIAQIEQRLTLVERRSSGKARATSFLFPLAVNNFITAAMNQAAENAPLGVTVITRDVVNDVRVD